MLTRFAGDFSIIWIPTCAGMTSFRSNGQSGFKIGDAHEFGNAKIDTAQAHQYIAPTVIG
jgi:hypothetical protein